MADLLRFFAMASGLFILFGTIVAFFFTYDPLYLIAAAVMAQTWWVPRC